MLNVAMKAIINKIVAIFVSLVIVLTGLALFSCPKNIFSQTIEDELEGGQELHHLDGPVPDLVPEHLHDLDIGIGLARILDNGIGIGDGLHEFTSPCSYNRLIVHVEGAAKILHQQSLAAGKGFPVDVSQAVTRLMGSQPPEIIHAGFSMLCQTLKNRPDSNRSLGQ